MEGGVLLDKPEVGLSESTPPSTSSSISKSTPPSTFGLSKSNLSSISGLSKSTLPSTSSLFKTPPSTSGHSEGIPSEVEGGVLLERLEVEGVLSEKPEVEGEELLERPAVKEEIFSEGSDVIVKEV